MSDDDFKAWYCSLPDGKKQIFLAFVSHDLTIHGRDLSLDAPVEQQIRGFKGLNELRHQVSSHIAALGLGSGRYPDDVLWEILRKTASSYGLSNHLKHSLERARAFKVWDEGG